MAKIGSLLLLLILISPPLGAAEVEALMDRTAVGVKQTFNYTVVVQSDEDVTVSDPKVVAPEGLTLVSDEPMRSSSTSSQLFQGAKGMQFKTTHSYEYHYQFRSEKEGKFVIPSFAVTAGKEILKTKPITVDVSKNIKEPQAAQADSDDPLDEAEAMFQQLLKRRAGGGGLAGGAGPALTEEEAKQLFFIKLDVDKTTAYEGEEIVANWWLYTRSNILGLDQLKIPELKGFWKETIEQVTNLQFSQEVVNGVEYRRALLASNAIFPLKAGTATIDAYKLKATIQSGGGFGQPLAFQRSSEEKEIKVIPLPEHGRPAAFTGAVGNFNVHSSVDQKNPHVDQPFSLKVRFEGMGNAKLIELPPLEFPEGLEKFDVKSSSTFDKSGKSSKEFEILLIPRHAGKFELPGMTFGFFDPKTKSYSVQTTDAITIEADGAASLTPALNAPEGGGAPAAISPLQLTLTQNSFFDSMAWPILLALNFLFLLGILIYAFVRWPRVVRDPHGEEILRRTKKTADVGLKNKKFRAAANDVMNGVHAFFGDVLNQSPTHAEINKTFSLLAAERRAKATQDYLECQRYFEKLAFSPEKDSTELQNEQLFRKNLASILAICEEVLKKIRLR